MGIGARCTRPAQRWHHHALAAAPGAPRPEISLVNLNRRTWLHAALAATLAPGAALAEQTFELTPWPAGTPLPPVQGRDLQGRPWRLADLRGRPVLLNFWATWCPPCRAEMPTLQQLAQLYGPGELSVIAMNCKQSTTAAANFARATNLTLPIVFDADGANARALGVSVFPTTFGIAADGTPRWRVRGDMDWTGREADRLVSQLLTR
jgi:thiol-disulfide isomerase/thioredoxin